MSDVSCRILIGHIDYLKKRGYNHEAFLNRLTEKFPDDNCLKSDFIQKPKNRIPWNSFADFCDLLAEWHKNDMNWESDYIEDSVVNQADWARHAWSSLNFLASPKQVYQLVCNFVGPVSFGDAIEPSFEELDNGRVQVQLKIKDGYRDNPLFFRLSSFGLAKAPRIIGLHESIVVADIKPHLARYTITPPPSRTLFARILRIIRYAFSSQNVLGELSLQDQELRQHYKDLFDSETELKRIRAELEKRVESSKSISSEVSHQMNNALQGIFLSLELASQKMDRSHPAFAHLESAKQFASRGQEAISQSSFDNGLVNKNSELKGTERILILDDDKEIASLLASSLSLFGYSAQSTSDVDLACEKVRAGQVDLVVTDFSMPLVNGFEATKKIREVRKNLPIILLSGVSDQLPEDELHKLGYFACMKKPIETIELLRVFRSALMRTRTQVPT